MKIAFAASEVFPYAKTGGLADVAGSLPIELSKLGHEVKVFMPKYNTFGETEYGLHYQWDIGEIPILVAGRAHSIHVHMAVMPNSNIKIYFVDCPHYFHRFRIYTNDTDEDERFILFSKGIIEILHRLQLAPDIIHCNDWHTGLLPILLKNNYDRDRLFDKTATILTIHNIAYQGNFPKETFTKAEISPGKISPNVIKELDQSFNFLKTGILTSDKINTVSETYARELITPEYGEGMQDYLVKRGDDFCGILNGVDYNIWNPKTDALIPYHYSINDLSGKLKNKKFLLKHLGLPFDKNIPVIGIISRLALQKGFDILSYGINQLMDLEAQWVILGSGDHKYERLFKELSVEYPKKVSVYLGFNNELAHLIEAGSDIFLMPSQYEPCGLNQIYSLKYGTVPVVRRTGGLADTVQDWGEPLGKGLNTGTGYSFKDYTALALINSIQRAVIDFKNKSVWKKIQLNAMSKDYSWKKSAEKYIELYKIAIKKKPD